MRAKLSLSQQSVAALEVSLAEANATVLKSVTLLECTPSPEDIEEQLRNVQTAAQAQILELQQQLVRANAAVKTTCSLNGIAITDVTYESQDQEALGRLAEEVDELKTLLVQAAAATCCCDVVSLSFCSCRRLHCEAPVLALRSDLSLTHYSSVIYPETYSFELILFEMYACVIIHMRIHDVVGSMHYCCCICFSMLLLYSADTAL